MEWTIAAGVAVLGTLAVGLVYYFVVGPSEVAKGRAEDNAEDKAKAAGLQVGADATQKMADDAGKVIDIKAMEQKARDPVDVANDAIAKRLGIGKKP